MTAKEVLERLRPKHYPTWSKDDPVYNHTKSTCDACLFDKAISDLIRAAILSAMNQERKECAKIVKAQIEDISHLGGITHLATTDVLLNLVEVARKIIARGNTP